MTALPTLENLPEALPALPLPAHRGGLFARHWRGDYSLARSYWVNGALIFHLGINMILCIVLTIVLATLRGKTALVLIVGFGEIALLVAAYVWALVGVWRSARKYQGPRIWPILARLAIIFGVLLSIANIAQTLEVIGRFAEGS